MLLDDYQYVCAGAAKFIFLTTGGALSSVLLILYAFQLWYWLQ